MSDVSQLRDFDVDEAAVLDWLSALIRDPDTVEAVRRSYLGSSGKGANASRALVTLRDIASVQIAARGVPQ